MLIEQAHIRSKPAARRGFTLIEAAIVTVIVGFGIVAMIELLATGTMANSESTELSTAIGLASNVHEMSLGVSYANIMTLDGLNYSPPVDARKVAISSLPNWKQTVRVNYVDPDSLTTTVPKTQQEPTALVTVTISHNGRALYTTDWLASATQWP